MQAVHIRSPLGTMATPDPQGRPIGYSYGYSADVDKIREQEYPHLDSMSITISHVN